MIAKAYKDMTEAELLEVKSNFEANRIITENQIKIFKSQIDVIDTQLNLVNDAVAKLRDG